MSLVSRLLLKTVYDGLCTFVGFNPKMIMIIFAGIAEFERDLIRERTGTGRKDAIQRGVRFGRPKKLSAEKQKLALRLLEEGKSIREIAKTFDVNRSTIYRLQQT